MTAVKDWMFFVVVETFPYAVKSYHVFLPLVVCQKRMPQIDALYLNVLHIEGQEKSQKCISLYWTMYFS